ncbi:DeoR/GlpR transcriptional regulator [Rhodocytophaga rosea]|uniref:DeoR/GlpR transcriptional regulator n=1 Tax=Rhodocytophaga rosea TaxID=2704465 RepID=A0A6C0GEA2_9BACT|nr:DeoR/GlpR family DNA-binding transcription regulator [Rhodocytophaga rosea]QHT66311.1 DeoR/GlpR transcriptional regulator [Rhodocytophaga rosea]
MNFQIRKQIILSAVELEGSVEVKELAEKLQTSEITVRRDLAVLAEKGLLFRTHGGAVKVSLAKDPVTFANKAATNYASKEHIAQLASQQIVEGDTVFIDCGSTTFLMCQFIRHLSIKVVTNSLPVVNELMGSSVQVNIAGGELDAKRQAIHGVMAIEHLKRYKVDKAFIGVDGISLKYGLSANGEKEASITLAAASIAKHVYLLCDSSKLEKEKYFRFAPLSLIHTLITDQQAPQEVLQAYKQAGLQILS